MDFDQRKEAAIKELRESAIWRSNGLPLILVLTWKMGAKVRPPHYSSFWRNAIFDGGWFALLWGLLMWLIATRSLDMSVVAIAIVAPFAGAFFGLFMATYYRWSARKHGLTAWEDLTPEE